MALSGHTTPQLAINNPAALSSYTGTVTGVTAGDLVVVTLELDGTSGTITPSAFTVTLGSDTLSFVSSSGTATLTVGIAAVFSVVATASGNQTLTVTPSGAPRALSAHAFLIQGFDTTTPIANSDGVNNYGGAVTALTSPNGVTTAASGNVIIGAVSIHSGGVTGISVATADGSSVGNNGTNTFNDNSWGVAWKETTPAASVTFAWTWTSAQRCGAAWVEINAATGGGGASVTTGAGSVTVQGQAPDAGAGATATTGTGAASVQGFAPMASAAVDVAAGLGAVTVQGFAPAAGGEAAAATGAGGVTVQGYAPTVATGGEATATPGTGALTLQGHARN